MLVLSRKLHEAIVIGDNIKVIVTDIHRGKIKLAIDAPKGTTILRGEVRDRQEQQAQKESAT